VRRQRRIPVVVLAPVSDQPAEQAAHKLISGFLLFFVYRFKLKCVVDCGEVFQKCVIDAAGHPAGGVIGRRACFWRLAVAGFLAELVQIGCPVSLTWACRRLGWLPPSETFPRRSRVALQRVR
jgi:hypothetical protein